MIFLRLRSRGSQKLLSFLVAGKSDKAVIRSNVMDDNLYRIYEELMKKGMTFESIYNLQYPKSEIIDELSHESRSWWFNVDELIDVRNWNLNNLTLEKPDTYVRGNIYYKSYIRKPKAYFELSITTKNNLVLDWYPYNPTSTIRSLERTDWIHWDNQWPQSGHHLPFNRVLMIRDLGRIIKGYKRKKYDKIDRYMIKWVKGIINDIYTFLDRFIEIEKITDLYLQYKDGHRRDKLVSCEIRNVREAEKEFELQKKMQWIDDTCSKLGISAKQFLNEFKKNNMKYAPTGRAISSKSATISFAKVKKLARELYEFPEIYDSILIQPPPGVKARSKGAEIISLKIK